MSPYNVLLFFWCNLSIKQSTLVHLPADFLDSALLPALDAFFSLDPAEPDLLAEPARDPLFLDDGLDLSLSSSGGISTGGSGSCNG